MHTRVAVLATAVMLAMLLAPAQAADFNDNNYHEYILYDMDQPEIDVLIVPPASPYYTRDLVNIEKSVQAWDDGINALGPSWLADGLNINYYTLGYDVAPPAALADPEIIIFSAEANPVLLAGIGLEPWQFFFNGESPCHGLDPNDPSDWHNHAGSIWASGQCDGGGSTCVVINTSFLWLPDQENEGYMYDLNQHELGHCLGIGHVGDALDFSAANFPEQDIMSYQHNANQVHCVSSLNILALEAVYGDLLGQPNVAQDAGTFVEMSPGAYTHVNCLNPNTGWLNVMDGVPVVGHTDPAPGSTISGGGGDPEPPAQTDVHVSSVAPSASHYGKGGHRLHTDVTVVDDQGAPVGGATVSIEVTSPEGNKYTAAGTTDGSGSVTLTVQQKNQGHGTWTSCVTGVSGSGLNYNSLANSETCDSAAVN